ncbi:MAG: hypothetical protein ACYS3N_00045 [Planctomycetota bacterium]
MHVHQAGHEVFIAAIDSQCAFRNVGRINGTDFTDPICPHDHSLLGENSLTIHGNNVNVDERHDSGPLCLFGWCLGLFWRNWNILRKSQLDNHKREQREKNNFPKTINFTHCRLFPFA